MTINANSAFINIAVTVLMVLMIFILPALDHMICRKLGISLYGSLSTNPDADRLLQIRQIILVFMFALYISALLYVTLFSRTAAADYAVHIALYDDLTKAVHIDLGFLELIRLLFAEGFRAALSHVEIVKAADITQVYMNIALMVPMGYLLPYIFPWFQKKVRQRPVLACFLFALLIENIQLMTRRGFYDVDALVSNTIGGFFGQQMYITIAYVLTHPQWRKDLHRYRRWRRTARKSALYPFLRRLNVSRTTIYASDETAVWDFYVRKLGFRVRRQLVPEDAESTSFLLEAAGTQVEILCSNQPEEFPEQYLTFSCRRLDKVKKRLVKHGIDDGIYESDPYTDVRTLRFKGPDHVTITILEE